jgi:hypothetical protein
VTSHRKPARRRFRFPCLPSLYALLGCTPNGRIMWFKVGWYVDRSLPDEWGGEP